MPGLSLTLYHLILANCTTPKPVSIVRFSNNTELFMNDTFIIPAEGLCLAVDAQVGETLHKARPERFSGVQSVDRGQPNAWCSRDTGNNTTQQQVPTIDQTPTPDDNASYTRINVAIASVKLYANTTGFGPSYAATLSDPATTRFHVDPTWPADGLCGQQAALLRDVAMSDPHGWVDFAADGTAVEPTQPIGSQPGGYNGTFMVHYIDTAWLCPKPLSVADCSNVQDPAGCLVSAYDRLNPDNLLVPGAAAYRRQQQEAARTYGFRVILPAVLATVGR